VSPELAGRIRDAERDLLERSRRAGWPTAGPAVEAGSDFDLAQLQRGAG
jgi:hypothetical protein